MKALYRNLVLLLVFPVLGLSIASGSGMNKGATGVRFFAHDSRQGLAALESRLHHPLSVTWNESNLTPSFIGGGLTGPAYAVTADRAADGTRFLSDNVDLFGLKNPSNELRVLTSFTDNLAMTHVKYQQQVNGVKVFQGQLVVHFSRDGSIESVNGRYLPTPEVNTIPTLGAAEATAIAMRATGNGNVTAPSAELNLYATGVRLLLVYAVNLPSRATPMMTVFVDANNGAIIKTDDGLRYDGPTVGSGIDLHGATRALNTYLLGGKYYMIDATLPMYQAPIDSLKGVVDCYDALNDTTGSGYNSASLIFDPNNDDNFNDNVRLQAGVSVQLFTREVYQYYKLYHNRNSWNGNGGSLLSVIHYKQNYNNAYWNGVVMTYGDGDGVTFSNLAGALDVIGHELTHGVTNSTADLVYELQPGALNESVSDAFACLIDSSNWLIGEDVYTPGTPGDALRSMSDPHNGHVQGDPEWQPANMSEFVDLPNDPDHDHGGVHINSGIMNKAFYNVATAIGRPKSGMIWYRALTTYLTNNSQFSDMRAACIGSAKDLFGTTSTEQQAVADAFTAVGVTDAASTYQLVYDDGNPGTSVYETDANWELAVRFTSPVSPFQITTAKIMINGDNNGAGTGHFTLKMYSADGPSGLPGTQLITPYSYTPAATGWSSFTITGLQTTGEFYVSMLYDGTNQPLVAADNPPGNMRAYEFNAVSWSQLTSPNDYTLFMRATVQAATGVVDIDSRVPAKFALSQNFPNPFNPSTSLRLDVPVDLFVRLAVYDITGAKVADLADNHLAPGSYTFTWNGMNTRGEMSASGVYFTRVEASKDQNGTIGFRDVRKMLFMK